MQPNKIKSDNMMFFEQIRSM